MNKLIGTHSGRFHTDEILATVMIKYLDEFKDANIIRTRDQEKLDKCDIIVDVGGVYDHSKKRYDHHQKEFKDVLDEKHTIRLSSAGLIYKHYGKEILEKYFKISGDKLHTIYDIIYTVFIEAIDAIDNGVNQYDAGTMRYEINTTLQNRVNRFNPHFLEDDVDEDERFIMASKIVKEEFEYFVNFYSNVWYEAKTITLDAINKRFDIHKSGKVILLSKHCPYYHHLYEIEKEKNIKGEILYVLYKDRYNKYRCGAVSIENESFTSRLPLSEKCRGLKDEELEKVSNIKGLTFVHYSGFTSGGVNFDSLIKLIEQTLKENNISY